MEEWTDGIVSGSLYTVVRGASWPDPARNLAAGFLQSQPQSVGASTIGFQVVHVGPGFRAANCPPDAAVAAC